jgi:hypothetical protein
MGRLILLLWPLALASFVVETRWFTLLTAATFALYALVSLVSARTSDRIFCAIMGSASAAVLALDGRLVALPAIFAQTVVFAAFVASAQLLRSVSEQDARVARFRAALAAQPGRKRPVWMVVGSCLLGSVLTIGAVAILAPLFAGVENPVQRREDAVATLSGTALAVSWSPFFVSIAVVSAFFPQVPIWNLMMIGCSLSAIGMLVVISTLRADRPVATAAQALVALRGFVPVILVAGLSVTLLRHYGHFSTLEASCLALPPLCVLLVLTSHARPEALSRLREVARATHVRIRSIGPDVAVVAFAFMFGLILRDSAMVDAAVATLGLDALPAPLLLVLVPLIMMGLGMLSVHPIVSASLLMSLLSRNDALSDLALAGATLVGWSAAAMVSYSGLLLMVTTSVSAVPRGNLVFSRNLLLAPVYAVTSALLLAALNRTIN